MMNILEKFAMKDYCSIITGGATGLGKAMAEGLADMGSHIVIADRDRSRAEQTAEAMHAEKGVRVLAIEADVTRPEDVQRIVEESLAAFGKIDVLVNNAGIVRTAKAEDMSFQDWSDVINVNLNGVFLMSQAVGRVMIQQQKGSIVNISSMSGIIVNTPQGQCSYNASKAAVISLTKSMAAEWASHSVRVNTIAPGYMKTELTKHFFEQGGGITDLWMERTPLGRPGIPEDLAGIVVYLASEASSYATGGVFVVDGGYTVL
jgi:NAD(P)-dependent dehydrogenase (short-subunit alcohol dehydrogenase family)